MLKLYLKLLAISIDKYKSDIHSVYKPIFGVKHDIQHSNSANSDLQQPQQYCFEITNPSLGNTTSDKLHQTNLKLHFIKHHITPCHTVNVCTMMCSHN